MKGPKEIPAKPPVPQLDTASTQALATDLDEFSQHAISEIEAASDALENKPAGSGAARAALRWRLLGVSSVQAEGVQLEPVARLLDLWSLFTRLRDYYTLGDGKDLFGPDQHIAVDTTTRLENEIETIAQRHIPPEQLPQVVRTVDEYAKSHPYTGTNIDEIADDLSDNKEGINILNLILSSPARAAGAAGKALDPTSSLAQAVDRFTAMAEDYPRIMRWQAKLLWLDLEQSATLRAWNQSAERFSHATEQLATTADRLPQQLREESSALISEIEGRQDEIQETLREAKAVAQEWSNTMTRTEQVANSMERVVQQVQEAGPSLESAAKAVTETVQEIQVLAHKDSTKPNATPTGEATPMPPAESDASSESERFDINDYRRTADAIQNAGNEIRVLLAEIRETLSGDEIPAQLAQLQSLTDAAIDRSSVASRGVVDHAAWRVAQLITLFFVLSIVHHWARSRGISRKTKG